MGIKHRGECTYTPLTINYLYQVLISLTIINISTRVSRFRFFKRDTKTVKHNKGNKKKRNDTILDTQCVVNYLNI